MGNSGQQRNTADHMIDAVGYLIVVADRFELRRVSNRLQQVRSELALIVANDQFGTENPNNLSDVNTTDDGRPPVA